MAGQWLRIFQCVSMITSVLTAVSFLIVLIIAKITRWMVRLTMAPDEESTAAMLKWFDIVFGLGFICAISLFVLNLVGYQGAVNKNKAVSCGYSMMSLGTFFLLLSFIIIATVLPTTSDEILEQDFYDYDIDRNARAVVDDYQRTNMCCGTERTDFIIVMEPIPSSCCSTLIFGPGNEHSKLMEITSRDIKFTKRKQRGPMLKYSPSGCTADRAYTSKCVPLKLGVYWGWAMVFQIALYSYTVPFLILELICGLCGVVYTCGLATELRRERRLAADPQQPPVVLIR